MVIFVNDAFPNIGVTNVGEVLKTATPVPVSLVNAEARLALEGVPKNVATPVPSPETPVSIGNPVPFVNITAEGVPKSGEISVGVLANTNAPPPVSSEITPAS